MNVLEKEAKLVGSEEGICLKGKMFSSNLT